MKRGTGPFFGENVPVPLFRQHLLYFRPLPHGQGLRPVREPTSATVPAPTTGFARQAAGARVLPSVKRKAGSG